MEGRMMSVTLVCLALSGVGAIQVNIPQDVYEFARGDNITLPCSFTPKAKNPVLVIITWTLKGTHANAKKNRILTHYSKPGNTEITPLLEGRASLTVDVPTGKADLKISSISLADNNVFECRVQVPGDDEGKQADTARLVVLVAPSVPICKIQGKAEYGQNINLTCVSKEGSPPPEYTWTSYVKSTRRPFALRTAAKGGILSLYNITKDTSGYYICTSRNKIREASCSLTLAVMPSSMNLGSTAGIIGGVVFALILLIIIIVYCCRYMTKKKMEERCAFGVREGGYSDKEPPVNGEDRQADGQEDGAEYDDVAPANC